MHAAEVKLLGTQFAASCHMQHCCCSLYVTCFYKTVSLL